MGLFTNLKRIRLLLLIIVLVGMTGCSKGYSIFDGEYYPEGVYYYEDGRPMMYFVIDNDEYTIFSYITVDFVPSGKVERKGNELILGDYRFEIIDDNKVKYVTDNPDGIWDEGMIFTLKNTSEYSPEGSLGQNQILSEVFNDNQKHIQDLSSFSMSLRSWDDKAMSISLDDNAKLPNHNNRVYHYKLQDGKVFGDSIYPENESLANNEEFIDALRELKTIGDIDSIFIEEIGDVPVVSFSINKSVIPEICESNNNAGAVIIYCPDTDYANEHGYILIADNYYGYVYPRPE